MLPPAGSRSSVHRPASEPVEALAKQVSCLRIECPRLRSFGNGVDADLEFAGQRLAEKIAFFAETGQVGAIDFASPSVLEISGRRENLVEHDLRVEWPLSGD